MGVLGGVFVLKSGLRILIWAPQVPFLVPPKTLGVPFRHFGNHFGPGKSDFWPFYFFGHFPIEIPMGPAGVRRDWLN